MRRNRTNTGYTRDPRIRKGESDRPAAARVQKINRKGWEATSLVAARGGQGVHSSGWKGCIEEESFKRGTEKKKKEPAKKEG